MRQIGGKHTTGVVTGSQQNTTGSLANADQVARSGGGENAILAHQELLDTVGGTDLGDLGDDLRVVVTAITANDEEGILDTLGDGEEDAGNEGLGVVVLLEDLDLLAKTRARGVLEERPREVKRGMTYVPGFWSVKGWIETVWTDMMEDWGGVRRKLTDREGLASCVDHPTETSLKSSIEPIGKLTRL